MHACRLLIGACALLTAACLPLVTPEMPGVRAPLHEETTAPPVAVDPFVWSADRRLTWEDFQGPPDRTSRAVATTAYAIVLNTACQDDVLVSRVTSTFLPHASWVRPTYIVHRLAGTTLRHEQAHFDLSEVMARRLRAELRSLRSPCDGADPARLAIYARYKQDDAKVQRQYDRETEHGTILRQQRLWEARIQAWLAELPE